MSLISFDKLLKILGTVLQILSYAVGLLDNKSEVSDDHPEWTLKDEK